MVRAALTGTELVEARRRGKLMLVDVSSGAVIGLHLGMSGRVIIDGEAAGDPLVYASNRDVAVWHRFGLGFADGGSMFLRDPRRLGAVELDPDEDRLGPDAFVLTLAQLRAVVARSRAPIKAVIMDQSRIAGLGNLLCDEALWRAGIDPARAAPIHSPTPTRSVCTAHPRHVARTRQTGRLPHRGSHVAARAGLALPTRRRTVAAPDRRWPHDVLVPTAPGLSGATTSSSAR